MDFETILTILLVGFFIYFSIDFNKHYMNEFHEASRYPIARFIAGMLVVYLSSINPILGSLALSIVFFWIADIHLLSTIVL